MGSSPMGTHRGTIKSAFQKTGILSLQPRCGPKRCHGTEQGDVVWSTSPSEVAPEIKQLADLMQNLALGSKRVGSKAGNEEVAEGTEGSSTSQAGDDAQYRDSVVSETIPTATVSVGSSASTSRNDLDIEQSIKSTTWLHGNWDIGLPGFKCTHFVNISHPPPRIATVIQPPRKASIGFIAKTLPEQAILAALHASEEKEEALYHHVLHIQAANILNELYCCQAPEQLACKEKKKSGGKGRLMGMAYHVSFQGTNFMRSGGAWGCSEAQGKSVGGKERATSEMARDDCRVEESETKRKEENKEWCERFQEAVNVWEKLREEAAVKAGRPSESMDTPSKSGNSIIYSSPSSSSSLLSSAITGFGLGIALRSPRLLGYAVLESLWAPSWRCFFSQLLPHIDSSLEPLAPLLVLLFPLCSASSLCNHLCHLLICSFLAPTLFCLFLRSLIAPPPSHKICPLKGYM